VDLASLEKEFSHITKKLDALRNESADLSKELTGLRAENRSLTDAAAATQRYRADLESRLGHLTADLGAVHGHVRTLEAERAAVLSSISWRLTAPLRSIGRALVPRD
jgi:hypothetical protein